MKYRFTSDEVHDLLHNYNQTEGIYPDSKPDKVYIWDETLRDGEQSPGVFLTKEEKIAIAKALSDIGVSMIAVGFPAVSDSELETVKAIVNENLSSKVVGIARPRKDDIDACIKADLDEIVLFMPISDLMMKVIRVTREEEYKVISEMITYAKEHGIRVNWVSEDSSRARLEHIIKVFRTAVESGASRIVLSDTVGILNPRATGYLCEQVRNNVLKDNPDIKLGIHMHNDFGLAVANTLEGVFQGVTYPHTCVNGYGERAGNAALEDLVVNLETNGIKTGIKLDKLPELSALVEKLFCLPLQAHKPIVGDFAFSHESGLHVNAILSHPLTYEPINPKIIGRKRKFYLGKLSGSGAIINALADKLKLIDIDFPKEKLKEIVEKVKTKQEKAPKDELRRIFREIKKNMAHLTSGVSDSEFYEIVREVAGSELKKILDANKGMLEDVKDI